MEFSTVEIISMVAVALLTGAVTWFGRGVLVRLQEGKIEISLRETERLKSLVVQDVEQDAIASKALQHLKTATLELAQAQAQIRKLRLFTLHGVQLKPAFNEVAKALQQLKTELINAGSRANLYLFEVEKQQTPSDADKNKAKAEIKTKASNLGVDPGAVYKALKEIDSSITGSEAFASKSEADRQKLLNQVSAKLAKR